MSGYPTPAQVVAWTKSVQPVGPRDTSLWGYAYAARFGDLPSGSGGLAAFNSFQQNCYQWVQGTQYWDVDFLLAYIQANGDFPGSLGDFTAWLESNGYAKKGPNGADAKTGVYPSGGAGYPPAGGAPASASQGTSSSASGTLGQVQTVFGGLDALWKEHPAEVALAGAVAGWLLLGRR